MRAIPLDLLSKILKDNFYKKCCISGLTPVQLHHNFIFGGRQVNESWAILPLHKSVHDKANERELRDKLDWIMLNRATPQDLIRHSKVIDLKYRKKLLNKKFGTFPEKLNA